MRSDCPERRPVLERLEHHCGWEATVEQSFCVPNLLSGSSWNSAYDLLYGTVCGVCADQRWHHHIDLVREPLLRGHSGLLHLRHSVEGHLVRRHLVHRCLRAAAQFERRH